MTATKWTWEELRAMRTIKIDGSLESDVQALKVDNHLGRVWIDANGGVGYWRWIGGELIGLDANGNPWTSLSD